MRFRDLNEYGMTPGKPSYSKPLQKAKAHAAQKDTQPTDAPAQQPKTSTQTQPQQPTQRPATDLQQGDQIVNDDGSVGVVVSPIGDGNNQDKVVVRTADNKYYAIDSNDEVNVAVTESHSYARSIKNKLLRHRRKFDKLARKKLFDDQGEVLFEIDFNDPNIAKEIMDSPVSCGFEAEIMWPDIDAEDGDVYAWEDDIKWDDVTDNLTPNDMAKIHEAYSEWIIENMNDQYVRRVDKFIEDNAIDEDWIDQYIDARVTTSEIDDYIESSDEPKDSRSQDDWARDYVEEEVRQEFLEWLHEQAGEDPEVLDDAYLATEEKYSIDDWARMEYSTVPGMLASVAEFYLDPTSGGENSYEMIADALGPWIRNKSQFKDVKTGDYHSTASDPELSDQDFWRVEPDSSIDTGNGATGEIISPVYPTIRAMLEELKSLFNFLSKEGVETNDSTGFHVTMSLSGDEQPLNRLKLALLLGDKYLLRQFDRLNNDYSQSQMNSIRKTIDRMMDNPEELKQSSIDQIEAIVSRGISMGKFSSINFKDVKNPSGNNLVEFRIAGNEDYHNQFEKIAKTVVRYGITLSAAHDPTAFKRDYIKALVKAINQQPSERGLPEDTKYALVELFNTYISSRKKETPALVADAIKKGNTARYTSYLTSFIEDYNEGSLRGLKPGDKVPPRVSRLLKRSFKQMNIDINDFIKRDPYIKEPLLQLLNKSSSDPVRVNFQGGENVVVLSDQNNITKTTLHVLPAEKVKIIGDIYVNYTDDENLESRHERIVQLFQNATGLNYREVGKAETDQPSKYEIVRVNNKDKIEHLKNALADQGEELIIKETKFNELNLLEQLEIVNRLDEQQLNEQLQKQKLKESVPERNPVKDIKDIMSQPLLAGDLRRQMEAYFLIPDPTMIREFRHHRSAMGDDSDMREIFRRYAKAQLHPSVINKVNKGTTQ